MKKTSKQMLEILSYIQEEQLEYVLVVFLKCARFYELFVLSSPQSFR